MWWRVRTNLPDRPGSLAELARACGEAGVNILGLQVFPGIGSVTDELVLRVPDGWTSADLLRLVGSAGGEQVAAVPCTETALVDQATRYVRAARTILAEPAAFPEVVAGLFDAGAGPEPLDADGAPLDVMDMRVGDVSVQVRRRAPFTATEHARGAALADLVDDVLARSRAEALPSAGRRLGEGAVPQHVTVEGGVRAVVDGVVVGAAALGETTLEWGEGVRPVRLSVDPAWRRRGVGTRLLVDVARRAGAEGATDILLDTAADNQAVLPMVLAAGLRGRIRMSADRLTVLIGVRELSGARS